MTKDAFEKKLAAEIAAEIKASDKKQDADLKPFLNPSLPLLCKLGSIVVHADEATGPTRHQYDLIALRALVEDPEVKAWLVGMQKASFVPVKR